jgi:hypothetical protein
MAEAKIDPRIAKLEKRVDQLEGLMRANGWTMPGEGERKAPAEDDAE